jgi:hypothetical protein
MGPSWGRQACPTAACRDSNFKFFLNFLFGGMRYLGKMGAQYTHFFKLPPTLGSVKSSIPHKVWRFYFLGNFIFSKFRIDLDLHIYRLDFCFMEN